MVNKIFFQKVKKIAIYWLNNIYIIWIMRFTSVKKQPEKDVEHTRK